MKLKKIEDYWDNDNSKYILFLDHKNNRYGYSHSSYKNIHKYTTYWFNDNQICHESFDNEKYYHI